MPLEPLIEKRAVQKRLGYKAPFYDPQSIQTLLIRMTVIIAERISNRSHMIRG